MSSRPRLLTQVARSGELGPRTCSPISTALLWRGSASSSLPAARTNLPSSIVVERFLFRKYTCTPKRHPTITEKTTRSRDESASVGFRCNYNYCSCRCTTAVSSSSHGTWTTAMQSIDAPLHRSRRTSRGGVYRLRHQRYYNLSALGYGAIKPRKSVYGGGVAITLIPNQV